MCCCRLLLLLLLVPLASPCFCFCLPRLPRSELRQQRGLWLTWLHRNLPGQAARELKRQAWRFHKQHSAWFQVRQGGAVIAAAQMHCSF